MEDYQIHLKLMDEPKPSKLELYKQKVTIDSWRLKLYELQDLVKKEQEAIEELLKNLDPAKEKELPEEEQKENKEKFRKEMFRLRSNIKTLNSSIQEHRQNKNMSQFFAYIPNENVNRSQRRRLLKLRAKNNKLNKKK